MRPDVVESLNAFADSLRIWGGNPQKWEGIFTDSFLPLGCRLHTAPQVAGFENALEELSFYKPEIGKSLKEHYDTIVSSARTIDDKVRECPFPSIEKLDFRNNKNGHWISDYLAAFQVNLTLFERKIRHIAKKLAETEQNTTGVKEEREKAKTVSSINIQNSNVILGDVQAENLQIADDASIHKQPTATENKRGIIRKLLKIVVAIVVTVIATIVVDILADFGWLQSIKEFIYNNLWPK